MLKHFMDSAMLHLNESFRQEVIFLETKPTLFLPRAEPVRIRVVWGNGLTGGKGIPKVSTHSTLYFHMLTQSFG